ncbi:hypothetical protein DPMN_088771 [Dreissena polymorpha]|uniref:Uncharacterized protein n=1 Tax=Dreissena polymorpha TaxID=45954 RepID=A0A9D4KUP2_DREPO|nr:hypothetical protein DPMN_088771 [Dreissena polymorpha]
MQEKTNMVAASHQLREKRKVFKTSAHNDTPFTAKGSKARCWMRWTASLIAAAFWTIMEERMQT